MDLAAFKSAYDLHIIAYDAHAHGGNTGNTQPTISGKTDTYALEGAKTFGTLLLNGAMTQVYYDATGHITTSAGGNTTLGTGVQAHTHASDAGVATIAVADHAHTIAAAVP